MIGLDLDAGAGLQPCHMTTRHAIETIGLTKSYGDQEVLRGVDLAVPHGSIFALLGSNGAGKTTAVRILSTLLRADGGTASVNGYDVATQPAQVRESISLTGQFAAVDEILTGRENLVLVAELRRLERPGRIADDLLARFALTDAGDRRTATYSGGMRRRLDIAMSLIGDAPGALPRRADDRARPTVPHRGVEDRAGARRRGTTVLLTTQYLDEAEQLADRIAILHEGRIIADGTLAELKRLFPPAKVEYVEKQPTLEDDLPRDRRSRRPPSLKGSSDDHHRRALRERHHRPAQAVPAPHPAQPGHHHHHRRHPDRHAAAVRLRLRRRDRRRRRQLRRLPAAGHPAHHRRLRHRLHGLPTVHRRAERHLRAVPVDADRPVGRAVGARADLARGQPRLARARRARRPGDGIPLGRRTARVARGRSGSWCSSPWP